MGGIARKTELRPEHLHALFLYTDFTAFCTAFSSTFRATSDDESIDSINARHSRYCHTAKALRELVFYYGSERGTHPDGAPGEVGPFFCGVSCVLNIPGFSLS